MKINKIIESELNKVTNKKFNLLKENFSSNNLFEEINRLTETQVSEISEGIEFISLNMPNSVLIGGSAVVYYLKGGRSLTPDIDFLVPDIESSKDSLSDEGINFEKIMGNTGSIGINIPDFNIDLLDMRSGNIDLNKLILRNFNKIMFGGIEIKIIDPELLYIMKLELGRDKDVSDAFALANQKGLLNVDKINNYLRVLKGKLGEYESIESYIQMIK